jgi:hypothetical protein
LARAEYVEEAKRLAPYAYQIERDGEYLRFQFSAGRRVVLVSSPDGCEGDGCTSYFFQEYIPKLDSYLVEVQYYETADYLLIHRRNGQQTQIAAYPEADPTGQRFIAIRNDEMEGYVIQIWRLTANGPSLEFTYEPPQSCGFVAWRSPDQVELLAKPYSDSPAPGTPVHLIRRDDRWHLIYADDMPMQVR